MWIKIFPFLEAPQKTQKKRRRRRRRKLRRRAFTFLPYRSTELQRDERASVSFCDCDSRLLRSEKSFFFLRELFQMEIFVLETTWVVSRTKKEKTREQEKQIAEREAEGV